MVEVRSILSEKKFYAMVNHFMLTSQHRIMDEEICQLSQSYSLRETKSTSCLTKYSRTKLYVPRRIQPKKPLSSF